jgi:hypothetical protein
MAFVGLTSANNLSDVASAELAWDNLGSEITAQVPIGGNGLSVALYASNPSNQLLEPFANFRQVKIESSIDFTQQYDINNRGDGAFFALKITGQIQATKNGANNFIVVSDDGVRVWFDGDQVVDAWAYQGPTPYPFTIDGLSLGQWYPIEIHFFQGSGPATLRLLDGDTNLPFTAFRTISPVSINFSIKGTDILALNGVSRVSARDLLLLRGLTSNAQVRLNTISQQIASGIVLQDNALLKASPTSIGNYSLNGNLAFSSARINNIAARSLSTSPFASGVATTSIYLDKVIIASGFTVHNTTASGSVASPELAIPIEDNGYIYYMKAGQS